ncbi:sulfatase [Engelhardtia mirabilis]|uniref:Choline-sulfatase n=1 Tax=Engelhardtia mirabilis TaxID=2528011 RepID=A0A518BNS0_9BACT|nr:Choline-sulfatase [Planctomycetes bacterium Pla133]QDV02959.1 Choline-sulfatase [Planctomycetes bacterium Pla86]
MGPSNRARAAALVAICTLVLIGCGSTEVPAPRPNVLLLVVDTLRADRLDAEHMPQLAAFADEGLRFVHAQSPRAKTTPAVASLFTGLYPPQHGVRDLTVPLPASHPTLAERLSDAGYATAAIVGNFVMVRRRSALDRGFDLWVEDLPQSTGVPPSAVPQRTAESLTDGALAALGLRAGPAADGAGPSEALDRGDQPWFLYLHYMDPHGAYEPPADFPPRAGAPDMVPTLSAIPRTELHRPRVATYNVPESARTMDGGFDAAAVRALYDAEVRFVDAQLGRLFEELRTAGMLEDTLVVVTADHGESLGEHLYWFEHGLYAYEATCRVPLVVRFPGAWPERPAGITRASDVSLADVAPTLLELLDLPPLPPAWGDAPTGQSCAANWLAGEAGDHPVFSDKSDGADLDGAIQIKAVRFRTMKLIRRFTYLRGADGPELRVLSDELYDLGSDPDETVNRIDDPALAGWRERLTLDLVRYFAADADLPAVAASIRAQREELRSGAADDVRHLQALGYW